MRIGKNPLVSSREISALVGISIADHAKGLEGILEELPSLSQDTDKYYKNAEIKYSIPGIFVRSKLLWKLGIEKVDHDEPGSPKDITEVTSIKRLRETLQYFAKKGYERATAVTNNGKLIPHVKIETGDLRNGGIIKIILEQMTGALFERAHLVKDFAIPRKYQRMEDLYEEQVPHYSDGMVMSTKSEAAHICGYLAANFPRYFMLSQMNHDEITSTLQYPNIIDAIKFAKGGKDKLLLNRQEAVILNSMSLRNSIDKAPPAGTTQIFYSDKRGKRSFSLIRFEYLGSEKKLLKGISPDRHDDAIFMQHDNKSIVCVLRHYSTSLRKTPTMEYQKIIMPEIIKPYRN